MLQSPSGQELSIVTLSKFNVLADAVDDLRQKVYSTLPTNDKILEGVRTASNEKAITDMWSTLNVQGRLDAAENGIAKLGSLIQDLISETPELKRHVSKMFVFIIVLYSS
ncbi:hypothetical protein O0L34_g12318 [Tuta absoluta]|nr:hypothetical protein O0L34_g12318 [Tuta absoluta]